MNTDPLAGVQSAPGPLTPKRPRARLIHILILPLLLLASCSGALQEEPAGPAVEAPVTEFGPSPEVSASAPPTVSGPTANESQNAGDTPPASASGVRINRRVDVPDDIDFPRYIPADGILPIYDPKFVGAEEAPLKEDELVLAISIDGQAKAYPITVLRSREMVNDELAGIPILATW